MNDTEAGQFIEKVLKPLWPRWNCQDEESRIWTKVLVKYDYNLARQAVNNMFIGLERRGIEPIVNKVIQAIKKNRQRVKPATKPVLLYTIIKESFYEDGKNPEIYGKRFYIGGKKQKPPNDEIEKMAERDRRLANQIYAENHIIIRSWEQEQDTDKYPRTRKESLEAKESAFDDILSGRYDTNNGRTKRWLQVYLSKIKGKKHKVDAPNASRKKEPVPIGQIVDDVPF